MTFMIVFGFENGFGVACRVDDGAECIGFKLCNGIARFLRLALYLFLRVFSAFSLLFSPLAVRDRLRLSCPSPQLCRRIAALARW